MDFKSVLRYGGMLMLAAGVSLAGEFDQYKADVQGILPEFASFGKAQGLRVPLKDKADKRIGTLLLAPAGKYERIEGFNGYINTAVVVNKNNKVAGVALGENEETPRFLERVRKSGFLKKWNGPCPKCAKRVKVEAVSHATYSSKAIMGELKAIFNEHGKEAK